jgi:hypothetical protein
MQMSGYNVQCLSGHAYELPAENPLVERCKKYEEKGFLDALCLSEDECEQCLEDRREHLRREARLCGDVGCPMGEDDCKDGCLVLQELQALPQ